MPERFLVLRGAFDGPLYLAADDGCGDWTLDRDAAHRFDSRADAARAQERVVLDGVASAVVPEGCPREKSPGPSPRCPPRG